MQSFTDKVAVVTGAGSGIGRGMAIVFAQNGMDVVVADVEADAAEGVAAEVRALGRRSLAVQCDVANREAVRHLADLARGELGNVHVLCNNAGVSHPRRGTDATHEDWVWMLGVNLWGVIHGMECFLPAMLASGEDCHIVNTSSMNGIFPSAMSAMYSTSKYGLLGLTETFRNELAGSNVGISALCPAGVKTRIQQSNRNRPADLVPATPPPPHTPSNSFVLSPALEPEVVGEMVLNGIRRNQLYIFTDPLVRPMIEAHHEQMVAEFTVLDEFLRERADAQPAPVA